MRALFTAKDSSPMHKMPTNNFGKCVADRAAHPNKQYCFIMYGLKYYIMSINNFDWQGCVEFPPNHPDLELDDEKLRMVYGHTSIIANSGMFGLPMCPYNYNLSRELVSGQSEEHLVYRSFDILKHQLEILVRQCVARLEMYNSRKELMPNVSFADNAHFCPIHGFFNDDDNNDDSNDDNDNDRNSTDNDDSEISTDNNDTDYFDNNDVTNDTYRDTILKAYKEIRNDHNEPNKLNVHAIQQQVQQLRQRIDQMKSMDQMKSTNQMKSRANSGINPLYVPKSIEADVELSCKLISNITVMMIAELVNMNYTREHPIYMMLHYILENLSINNQNDNLVTRENIIRRVFDAVHDVTDDFIEISGLETKMCGDIIEALRGVFCHIIHKYNTTHMNGMNIMNVMNMNVMDDHHLYN
jgi:hypothetical protein